MKLTRPQVLLCAAAILAIAVAALLPGSARGHLSSAVTALRGADPRWLGLAAVGFASAFACTVGAWSAAFGAAGGRICPRQAAARLGVGSLVNTFAPARLGDAVKVALCSRAIDAPGRLWTAGGVYAALSAARCLALASLVVVAAATGALPWWPVLVLCGFVALLVLVGAFSGRLREKHLAQFVEGFAMLERSPRALATVLGWTFGMAAARLGATIAVAASLGIPHPVLAALVILPALDVASAFPITPGAVGIGERRGRRRAGGSRHRHARCARHRDRDAGARVGRRGGCGLVRDRSISRGRRPAYRWTLRVATAGASVALVAALGTVVLDLT